MADNQPGIGGMSVNMRKKLLRQYQDNYSQDHRDQHAPRGLVFSVLFGSISEKSIKT